VRFPSASALRAALTDHPLTEIPKLPGRRNHLRAGVLVPVHWGPDDLHVILTERAAHLSNHPGEVSFPGGRPEAEDTSIEETALREAEEEVGLRGAGILGRLSSIPLYTSDYRLEPFVAEVPEGAELVPCPDEVASILRLSVRETLAHETLHGIPWEHEGTSYLSPVFELGDQLVYGGTAHALHELLQVVAPLVGTPLPPMEPGRYTWSDILRRARSTPLIPVLGDSALGASESEVHLHADLTLQHTPEVELVADVDGPAARGAGVADVADALEVEEERAPLVEGELDAGAEVRTEVDVVDALGAFVVWVDEGEDRAETEERPDAPALADAEGHEEVEADRMVVAHPVRILDRQVVRVDLDPELVEGLPAQADTAAAAEVRAGPTEPVEADGEVPLEGVAVGPARPLLSFARGFIRGASFLRDARVLRMRVIGDQTQGDERPSPAPSIHALTRCEKGASPIFTGFCANS
jgi:8-oxo-dGTP pyrophosphatase MutT (NUDIX family)